MWKRGLNVKCVDVVGNVSNLCACILGLGCCDAAAGVCFSLDRTKSLCRCVAPVGIHVLCYGKALKWNISFQSFFVIMMTRMWCAYFACFCGGGWRLNTRTTNMCIYQSDNLCVWYMENHAWGRKITQWYILPSVFSLIKESHKWCDFMIHWYRFVF